MKYFNRIFAIAGLAGLAATGAALANHDESGFTAEEQVAVSMIHSFIDCVNDGLDASSAEFEAIDKRYPDMSLEERWALIRERIIFPIERECDANLGIDTADREMKDRQLREKHGPDVFWRPGEPMP